jgi:glutathione S-transferase
MTSLITFDDAFPEPPLKPSDPEQREQMYFWLRKAVEIHVKAIKTYIYDKRVGKNMAQNLEEEEKYRSLQTNPELLEFHRRSTTTGFTEEEVQAAEAIIDECFKALDSELARREWIASDAFSLADVAWIPLQFTLDKLAGYSFERYQNIGKWVERIEARPSYQKAVLDWFPPQMLGK